MDKRKQYNVNIIILGEDNVGKSSLTSTFQKEKIAKDGKIVNFNILDTDETIDNCDVAQAAIVVYDITNKDSFIHAQCLIRKLHHYAKSDILIALIGNKKDLESSYVAENEKRIHLSEKKGFVFEKLYNIASSGTSNITISLADDKNGDWSKRKVEYEEVCAYAKQNGLIFLETSAKSDQNVNKILKQIAKKIL